MMQDVNLLKALPSHSIKLAPKQMCKLVAGVVLVLMSVSFFQWGQVVRHYFRNQHLIGQQQQLEAQFKQLVKKYPIVARHHSLATAVTSLSATLKNEHDKFERLSEEYLTTGFSKYLKVLATHLPTTVSLQSFTLSQLNKNIILAGTAQHPQDVSDMIKHLYKHPLFKSQTFNKYLLGHEDHTIHFEIATRQLLQGDIAMPQPNKQTGVRISK